MIDLKNTKIKFVPKANQVKYLKEKGYEFEKGEEIEVLLSDISPNSHMKIPVPCEICGDIKTPEYRSYLKAINRDGFYCCLNCAGIKTHIAWNNFSEDKINSIIEKRIQTTFKKYGYSFASQVPEFTKKRIETNLNRYNCVSPSQLEEIKEKIRKTNFQKYGVEYYFQTQEFKDKLRESNIKKFGVPHSMLSPIIKEKVAATCMNKYGVSHPSLCKDIREKALKTMQRNGTFSTSSQQEYLAKILNLESNHSIDYYMVDLFDEINNVILEYDGGGHGLAYKLHKITKEEFQRKELIREKELRKKGYRIIRIISDKDVLPLIDMIHLMYKCALEYFNSTSHTWINFDLDNSIIRNAINPDGIYFDFGILLPINTRERKTLDILYNQEYSLLFK